MKTLKVNKIILPGTLLDESKFYELSNKYLKRIVKNHTQDWGIDILELLAFLAKEKSPAISGGSSYFTDNDYIGQTWITGSKKAVIQKVKSDKAANDIISLLREYFKLEESSDKKEIRLLKNELEEAVNNYNGIDTYLYFLLDEKSNAIKIGRSINVSKRKSTLQTGSPNELILIYKCTARKAWERLIKKELFSYHLRGEWYKCEKGVYKFLLWLKYVQENNLNPETVSRNLFDDESDYKKALKKLLNKGITGIQQ